MDYTILPATEDMAETLTEIAFNAKASWGYSRDFMSRCRNELAVSADSIRHPEHWYFVAIQGKSILAYAALFALDADTLELDALFIHPDSMGKGIGRSLLTHCIEFANVKNIRQIMVQSDPQCSAILCKNGGASGRRLALGQYSGQALAVFSFLYRGTFPVNDRLTEVVSPITKRLEL